MAKCVVAVFENANAKILKNMLSALFYYDVLTKTLGFVLIFSSVQLKIFFFL
jgi:hypothetical protein